MHYVVFVQTLTGNTRFEHKKDRKPFGALALDSIDWDWEMRFSVKTTMKIWATTGSADKAGFDSFVLTNQNWLRFLVATKSLDNRKGVDIQMQCKHKYTFRHEYTYVDTSMNMNINIRINTNIYVQILI